MNTDGRTPAFDLGTSSLELVVTTAEGQIASSVVER